MSPEASPETVFFWKQGHGEVHSSEVIPVGGVGRLQASESSGSFGE